MALSVRKMVPEDIGAVAELEKLCFSDAWTVKMLADTLDCGLDELWILETGDGGLAGYIDFRFIAGDGELMRIAVHPDRRGQGYSRKLMAVMEEAVRKNKIENLTLEVRAGNVPAIRLYQSCGFREEAVRKGYYHNPTEDAVIMWRRGLPAIPT